MVATRGKPRSSGPLQRTWPDPSARSGRDPMAFGFGRGDFNSGSNHARYECSQTAGSAANDFDEQAATRVKTISTTNHDVKAVEYYIKECFADEPIWKNSWNTCTLRAPPRTSTICLTR